MVEKKGVDDPVSLDPLSLQEALAGLLAIPDPERTKPKNKPKKADC